MWMERHFILKHSLLLIKKKYNFDFQINIQLIAGYGCLLLNYMLSFIINQQCSFFAILIKWYFMKNISNSKPERKAYHLKDTVLSYAF